MGTCGQALYYPHIASPGHHIANTRRGHKRWMKGQKFGAVIIINVGTATRPRYKDARETEHRTMKGEGGVKMWPMGRTRAFKHPPDVWPQHADAWDPLAHWHTGGSRHRLIMRTINMRIYFCHPMSQQIKRSGSDDVPCLCSVLQSVNFSP